MNTRKEVMNFFMKHELHIKDWNPFKRNDTHYLKTLSIKEQVVFLASNFSNQELEVSLLKMGFGHSIIYFVLMMSVR